MRTSKLYEKRTNNNTTRVRVLHGIRRAYFNPRRRVVYDKTIIVVTSSASSSKCL